MLLSLAIRDIVLIERLDLELGPGLTVLTGETGAGKSIILDALGLALGQRADRVLLRSGAAQGSVVAEFRPPAGHAAVALLAGQELAGEAGELVVRRTLAADGRSRAFVNDVPVSGAILRELGDALVEVHGQMDQRGLLDSRSHRAVLDAFAGHGDQLAATRAAHAAWRGLEAEILESRARVEQARREEDYLRHRLLELEALAPEAGEEERLAEERSRLLHKGKLVTALEEALALVAGPEAALARLGSAERRLARAPEVATSLVEPALAALGRALIEAGEAEAQIEEALREVAAEERSLEAVEERLFALRDAARKHRTAVDDLPALLERTAAELGALDAGAEALEGLERAARAARGRYLEVARALRRSREAAAGVLEKLVAAELPPLKLDKARLAIRLEPLDEEAAGPDGLDRVAFLVATNPGQPLGPIAKIASGGELSRLMLALKVVLARDAASGTLIFDEVDAGIGGATADAVGERLARLARERQVLVVTHAPQVAARADHHLKVEKLTDMEGARVEVRPLDAAERRDEIARMLAGAEITAAARAAATSLLDAGGVR
ncbi:MAG: DNA repair protein RecN [Geminicoccaceae bacterium]|jgi:DNA repair protein RecN (Recombination protein N)|nr:DNA repair protein RecN [Geminicoccaceae bacterium]